MDTRQPVRGKSYNIISKFIDSEISGSVIFHIISTHIIPTHIIPTHTYNFNSYNFDSHNFSTHIISTHIIFNIRYIAKVSKKCFERFNSIEIGANQ